MSFIPSSSSNQPATSSTGAEVRLSNTGLGVTSEFQTWKRQTRYKLAGIPTIRPLPAANFTTRPSPGDVQYQITYRDPHSQHYFTKAKSVNLSNFLKDLGQGSFDGTPISDVRRLHLQIPEGSISRESINMTPIFWELSHLVYLGDPQQLEQVLGISWSISFPQVEELNIQGPTMASTLRKALAGCPELRSLFVNILVQDDLRSESQSVFLPPRIEHPKLKTLKMVSNIAVHKPFRGLELRGLWELHLWMMPNVVMGLRPEHLCVHAERAGLVLNFEADDEFTGEVIDSRIFTRVTTL
ncbi:hypothetical protein BDN72DRAFT_960615 [Pluteus cervinus]|uniref:Uncharacterized protein n=1 Tax=Pluteus cervinus TaxID=181527 RepID=A0ACD3AQ59_9AGAR|nr:hypothetical protein BDN72DRAFT_960615 [Pluteus cervinus]